MELKTIGKVLDVALDQFERQERGSETSFELLRDYVNYAKELLEKEDNYVAPRNLGWWRGDRRK